VRPAQLKDIAKEFEFERTTKQLTKRLPWKSLTHRLTEICVPGNRSWDAAAAAAACDDYDAHQWHLEADLGEHNDYRTLVLF
jgi:hypothetical protein